jgi:hypothetical protein
MFYNDANTAFGNIGYHGRAFLNNSSVYKNESYYTECDEITDI